MSNINYKEVEIINVKFVNDRWTITYWESHYTGRHGFVKYPTPYAIDLPKEYISTHISQNFAYVKYYLERFVFGNG